MWHHVKPSYLRISMASLLKYFNPCWLLGQISVKVYVIEKEDLICRKIHRWIWNDYLCVSIKSVFLEYPRRGYNGFFEWFACGKADSVAWVGLWMATDLTSLFLRTEPFSSRFPYIFRLLDFFFDTEYYAILMSNSKCVFDNLSHTQVQSLRDLATHP